MRQIIVKGKTLNMPRPIKTSEEFTVISNLYREFINTYRLEKDTYFFDTTGPTPANILRDFNRYLHSIMANKLTCTSTTRLIIGRFVNNLSYNQLKRMVKDAYENPKAAIDKRVKQYTSTTYKGRKMDLNMYSLISNTVEDTLNELFMCPTARISRTIRDYTEKAIIEQLGVEASTTPPSTGVTKPTTPSSTPPTSHEDIVRMFNILMSNYVTIVSELNTIKRSLNRPVMNPGLIPTPAEPSFIPMSPVSFDTCPPSTPRTEPRPAVVCEVSKSTEEECACSSRTMAHDLTNWMTTARPSMQVSNNELIDTTQPATESPTTNRS